MVAVILGLLGALPFVLKLVLKWIEYKEERRSDDKVRKMGEALADGDTAVLSDLLREL